MTTIYEFTLHRDSFDPLCNILLSTKDESMIRYVDNIRKCKFDDNYHNRLCMNMTTTIDLSKYKYWFILADINVKIVRTWGTDFHKYPFDIQ